MLTGKQKNGLRGVTQTRKPLLQVGKDAINEDLIKTIFDSLGAHELVKVSLLKICAITAGETAAIISAATRNEVVQMIGRTFALYRRSKKSKLGLWYMRIAVLGGASNLVHNGHLQIARQVLKRLRVDEVWFMLSAATPLKQTQAAPFSNRAAMVALITRPCRHTELCTLEHELEGASYSIYTVRGLKKRHPRRPFYWLIGDDQVKQFDRWKDSGDLKRRLPSYAFSREQRTEQLPAGPQWVVIQLIPVSSDEVRKRHKLYQVPETVHAHMGLHVLYPESVMKEQMNEHRYFHSQSATQLCVELAQAHGLDTKIAYIMGITRGTCKQFPCEKAKVWMRAHMPNHLREAAAIWRSYIGADYVNKVLYTRNRRILQAIYRHVKGRNHTDFDRILFIAGKLDPLRGYDSRREIEISRENLREGYRVAKQQQEAHLRREGTLE